MRGKQEPANSSDWFFRNTPAYAGKTRLWSYQTAPTREHPRICGENAIATVAAFLLMRNTPAYAGKTLHHQRVHRAKPSFSITSSDNKNTTTDTTGKSNRVAK